MTRLKHRDANIISYIEDNGSCFEKDKDIRRQVVPIFSNLLSVNDGVNHAIQDHLSEAIPRLVKEEDNKMLTIIPSREEIKSVVFSFEGDKAPMPDGFPMFLFQWFWDIVAKNVVDDVKEFFGSKCLLKELNDTFLALIPKCPRVADFEVFKPRSLYNSFYKNISKVLTSRLLTILPSFISPQQNSFNYYCP